MFLLGLPISLSSTKIIGLVVCSMSMACSESGVCVAFPAPHIESELFGKIDDTRLRPDCASLQSKWVSGWCSLCS